MDQKFKIGDFVWVASFDKKELQTTCPDCLGKRELIVILGDDSTVIIPCAGCSSGYREPTGKISYWDWIPTAELQKITGMELSEDTVEYRSDYHCLYADKVFATQEEALVAAAKLAEEQNQREQERLFQKEKNNRTWAWHVTYHRRQIKALEKGLEYHRSKLEYAKTKTRRCNGTEAEDS